MASDNVSLTFRVSPEVVKLIDSQPGSTRTDRFERLIYKAFEELPRVQRELERVRSDIETERTALRVLRDKKAALAQNVNEVNFRLTQLLPAVDRAYAAISGMEVPDHG